MEPRENPLRLPLVLVDWNDAWVEAVEPVSLETVALTHKPTPVRTLGWVLQDDAAGISLANELFDGNYRGRSFIPRAMIVAVTPFQLTKPRTKRTKHATVRLED